MSQAADGGCPVGCGLLVQGLRSVAPAEGTHGEGNGRRVSETEMGARVRIGDGWQWHQATNTRQLRRSNNQLLINALTKGIRVNLLHCSGYGLESESSCLDWALLILAPRLLR
jgi:hypothetical protein